MHHHKMSLFLDEPPRRPPAGGVSARTPRAVHPKLRQITPDHVLSIIGLFRYPPGLNITSVKTPKLLDGVAYTPKQSLFLRAAEYFRHSLRALSANSILPIYCIDIPTREVSSALAISPVLRVSMGCGDTLLERLADATRRINYDALQKRPDKSAAEARRGRPGRMAVIERTCINTGRSKSLTLMIRYVTRIRTPRAQPAHGGPFRFPTSPA
ncbi:hypothetical protein EVAR_26767_1 [Eumeta japonica]|uniref:Uncharacterized protein n=1 Tax=Eumeta variegata TaxID=151549 RepID=A0A4C1XEW8_EUMVA|nr:hypothetical protein EVAR_26767_1 [Eumeta japonica]